MFSQKKIGIPRLFDRAAIGPDFLFVQSQLISALGQADVELIVLKLNVGIDLLYYFEQFIRDFDGNLFEIK